MGKVIKSICQMCQTAYGGCGIDVHIKNGKILKIEGTKGHPVNDGRLCAKGFSAIQLEYDTHRLQYLMKRVGEKGDGRWQRISWDTSSAQWPQQHIWQQHKRKRSKRYLLL